MKIARTLDQLQRGTERYVQGARAGRKNRLLATTMFSLCDDLCERADCQRAKDVFAKISTETETAIRLAHAANSDGLYAAWQRQRDAIAEARIIVAKEPAD